MWARIRKACMPRCNWWAEMAEGLHQPTHDQMGCEIHQEKEQWRGMMLFILSGSIWTACPDAVSDEHSDEANQLWNMIQIQNAMRTKHDYIRGIIKHRGWEGFSDCVPEGIRSTVKGNNILGRWRTVADMRYQTWAGDCQVGGKNKKLRCNRVSACSNQLAPLRRLRNSPS